MSGGRGVLLVGLGVRGRQWAEAVGAMSGFELLGAADPGADAAAHAQGAGIRHWPGLDAALAETRPDLAIVATPAELHADHAVACLDAGSAVLVEKPLAPSLADAVRIADAARRSSTPALVAQNFRFRSVELTIRRALERGLVGSPRSASMVSARAPAPQPDTLAHRPLWEFCVHHVDLWRSRLGRDPHEVEAEMAPDGAYLIRLRIPGPVDVVYRHREDAPCFHWYEWLEGESGALAIELERVRLHSSRHRPKRVRRVKAPAPERALLERAAGALASGETAGLGVGENLGTIATLEATIRSLSSGRAEPVSGA